MPVVTRPESETTLSMKPVIQLVRWFNRICPWHQPKPSLAKRCSRRLRLQVGQRVYGGIQGRFRMGLDLASDYERAIFLNCYEVVVAHLFRKILKPGDRYVDGGANLGVLALLASHLVGPGGKVFAFEPHPRTFERLLENLRLNGADNVTAVPKGCWDSQTTAFIYDFTDDQHDGSSLGRRSDRTVAQEHAVETTRIDAVVSSPVKLIKLDVEGAEWPALRGAERLLAQQPPPHLLVELKTVTAASFGYHPRELVDWLLERVPCYRMHLVKTRRRLLIDRGGLVQLLNDEPDKTHNVWFEPGV